MKYLYCSKKIIKKAIRIFLYNYTDGFLYIIAYLLYYLSLESCLEGEELCGNNMTWIYKKLFELILSCELISFLMIKIIFNYSSKLHIIHLWLQFFHYLLFIVMIFFFGIMECII